jgi:hypothetical protein
MSLSIQDLFHTAAEVIDDAIEFFLIGSRDLDISGTELHPQNADSLCCSDELLIHMKDW